MTQLFEIKIDKYRIALIINALETIRLKTEPGSWQRKDIDNLIDDINQQII